MSIISTALTGKVVLILKKYLAAALLCALLLGQALPAAAADAAPELSAQSAILVEKESGRVLLEKNADEKRLIASITKIMTALVVLEQADPEETVEIQREYTLTEGSSMYLQAGEIYSVRELLYGLLLHSGNDAATALACHVAGTEQAFAVLMNEKAAALGMDNSCFENPHGLDGAEHYSTARDMAKLTAAALDQPLFREIVSTKQIQLAGRQFTNHNKLLWNCPGAIGVKTGYTQAAGRTLVSACQRDGLTLICVTLCDGDDWNDHSRLYDWGFAAFGLQQVVTAGEAFGGMPLISGQAQAVGLVAKEGLCLFLKRDAEVEFQISRPDFAYAPVQAGSSAGRLHVLLDGKELGSVELVYASTVREDVAAQQQASWARRQQRRSPAFFAGSNKFVQRGFG